MHYIIIHTSMVQFILFLFPKIFKFVFYILAYNYTTDRPNKLQKAKTGGGTVLFIDLNFLSQFYFVNISPI